MDSDSSSQSSQDSQPEEMEEVSRKTVASVMGLYDQLLRANKMLDRKYQDQETALYNKLVQIRAEIFHKEDTEEPPKDDTFRYHTAGWPFFKDENFEAPPDTDDTRKTVASVMGLYDQLLRANQMLDKKYQDQETALYNRLVQIRAEIFHK